MKKVLITGENSYIGTSFEQWVEQWPDNYSVDTVDMKGELWRKQDFSKYDVVFHVAGIAHADIGKISKEQEELYYKVNYSLTIETAQKAKSEGVKQFIFMSSIIIYGESAGLFKDKIINKDTIPQPVNSYGDSKWKAEKGLRELESEAFKVVVVRPPMIYGKGSKGNYSVLAKSARKLPIFPNIDNKRSMLYIDNLCEFIKLMIEYEEKGVFFPQNEEFVKTSDLVKLIAKTHNKKIRLTKGTNLVIWLLSKCPGKLNLLINKAFGNIIYDMNLSEYSKGNYRIRGLEESIWLTER